MFRKSTPPTHHPKTNHTIVTDSAPCQKSVRLQVAQEAITPIRQAVLAEFHRQVTLPGFRKGKAPVDLIERQYTKDIRDETLHRVTKQAFEQAAKDYNLKPVGPFEVTTTHFSETDGLILEATVEVEPSFSLGVYQGIPLTRAPMDVTPQELDKALGCLQESMAQLVPAGTGETKERQAPPLDDDLAKDVGFATLESLRQHLEAKLREEKRAAQAKAFESGLCDELLKRHTIDVPARLVSRQTERVTRDFKVRLLLAGMSEEQVAGELQKFAEQLRTNAERHVKLAFILDRIATQESIAVTQDELVGRLWQLAQRWKKDPAEVRKIFDAQGLWPSVLSTIRQEKTMAFLLAAAALEDGVARGTLPSD